MLVVVFVKFCLYNNIMQSNRIVSLPHFVEKVRIYFVLSTNLLQFIEAKAREMRIYLTK